MTNDHLPEPDFEFDDDENESQDPDYWACYGCAKTTSKKQMGNMCPTCGAYMEPEYF